MHKPETQRQTVSSSLNLKRRELLAGVAGTAGMVALGAAGACSVRPPLVRPPGALAEPAFSSLCLKCDRCRSVCPRHCISVASWTDGWSRLRTPVMDFRHGYCDFCKKCVTVCPTGALHDFEQGPGCLGTAKLMDSCIALRTGGCTKCFEVCPQKAIALSATNVPIIDAERCDGCGLCEQVCPANVLQSYRSGGVRGIVVRPEDRGNSR